MKYLPTGSLQFYLSAPQMKVADLSGLNLQSIAKRVGKAWEAEDNKSGDYPSPDAQAVEFYALNHLSSIVRAKFTPYEPLPEWAVKVMEAYTKCLIEQSERMFCYMLLIITREARHCPAHGGTFFKTLNEKWGEEAEQWVKTIQGLNETAAVKKLVEAAPQMKLGPYVDSLTHVFRKSGFSGGYGGPAWGKISECLADMAWGRTSLEVMVDSSYSLAHNNGPIFNKGMLYGQYTENFITLLDVQRSGQIPELVLEGDHVPKHHVYDHVAELVKLVKAECPSAFGTYVDWYKVEALGAVKTYNQKKKAQDKKYGKSAFVPPPPPPPPETDETVFQILPGVSVTQFKRKAA